MCEHLELAQEFDDEVVGCESCLEIAGQWVHLRRCLICGKVGCCDQSPNRHATKHYRETQHPIVRSEEPGENWQWCYIDEMIFDHPDLP